MEETNCVSFRLLIQNTCDNQLLKRKGWLMVSEVSAHNSVLAALGLWQCSTSWLECPMGEQRDRGKGQGSKHPLQRYRPPTQ